MKTSDLSRRRFLASLAAASAAGAMRRGLAQPGLVDPRRDLDRPEFHLLPPHNWMNDPNGPIWWKGRYHLFYQLNPGAAIWGDMHWGHATSADMIHWHHQPVALAPTEGGPDGAGCFSGSAVVAEGVPTFIYTGIQLASPDNATIHDGGDKYRETQLLATADDETLNTWTKRAEPVIAAPPTGLRVNGFRDPAPWREDDGWYMVVGSGERGRGGLALLYRSQDLRTWEYLHPLAEGKPNGTTSSDPNATGEMWECPDFFPVGQTHCLIHSSEGKVWWKTGDYDRKEHRFHAKREGLLDYGAFYAPKSFLAPDGRRILWGWIQETRTEAAYAAAGWAGAMSLPRVLTADAEGNLNFAFATECESLREKGWHSHIAAQGGHKSEGPKLRRTLSSLRRDFELTLDSRSTVARLELLSNDEPVWSLILDGPAGKATCGAKVLPFGADAPSLRLLLDGSVLEAVVAGSQCLTSRVYGLHPGKCEVALSLEGHGMANFSEWPLRAISPDRLTG